MRYNKQELFALASQTSQNFDREGVIILKERQDSFFRRSEGYSARWFRLRGNLLFYLKGPEPWYEPLGVIVLGNHQVSVQAQDENGHWPFQLVWENGVCYRMGTFLESERSLWLKAMASAPYEIITQRIADLQQQLNDTRTMIDLKKYRATNNIINDFNEVPVCELSLSCDNLLCDANGNPPSPFATVFVIFSDAGLCVKYGCTEVVEKCSNPNFLRTIMFRESDGINSDMVIRILVYNMRETVTQTGVAIGSVSMRLSHIQEAQRLRVPLLTIENRVVGFVTFNGWSLETANSATSPTHLSNYEKNSIDLKPKLPAHRRSQSLPPRMGLKLQYPAHSVLIRQNFLNPNQATYRFHSGLGGDITVHEAIAEPSFCFTMPLQLVDIFLLREKELKDALVPFAEVSKRLVPQVIGFVGHHDPNKRLVEKAEDIGHTHSCAIAELEAAKAKMLKHSIFFKPSIQKVDDIPEDSGLAYVPVNLHIQRMWAHNDTLHKKGFHDIITVGAFTAHTHSAAKPGGLIRLLQQSKDISTRKAEMTSNSNRLDAEFEKVRAMKNLQNILVAHMDSALLLLHKGFLSDMRKSMSGIRENVKLILDMWNIEATEEALSKVGWHKKRIDDEDVERRRADDLALQTRLKSSSNRSACADAAVATVAALIAPSIAQDGDIITTIEAVVNGADGVRTAAGVVRKAAAAAVNNPAKSVPKPAGGKKAAKKRTGGKLAGTKPDFVADAHDTAKIAVTPSETAKLAVIPSETAKLEVTTTDASKPAPSKLDRADVFASFNSLKKTPAVVRTRSENDLRRTYEHDSENKTHASWRIVSESDLRSSSEDKVNDNQNLQNDCGKNDKNSRHGAKGKFASGVTATGTSADGASEEAASTSGSSVAATSENHSDEQSAGTSENIDLEQAACSSGLSAAGTSGNRTKRQAASTITETQHDIGPGTSNYSVTASFQNVSRPHTSGNNNRGKPRGCKNNRPPKLTKQARKEASKESLQLARGEKAQMAEPAELELKGKTRLSYSSTTSLEQVTSNNLFLNKNGATKKGKKNRRESVKIDEYSEVRAYNLNFFKTLNDTLHDMMDKLFVNLNTIRVKGFFTPSEFEDSRILMDLTIKLLDEIQKWNRMAHTAMRIDTESISWTVEHLVLQTRRDICFSQALTAAAAGVLSWVTNTPDEIVVKIVESGLGPLLGFEGLLSMYQQERTMWGDMVIAVEDLHTLTFKLVPVTNSTPIVPQVVGSRSALIIEIPIMGSLFSRFENKQTSPLFTVTAVFFNIGINEKASLAETLGDNKQQYQSNKDNYERIFKYYLKYCQQFPQDPYEQLRVSSRSKPLEEVMENLRSAIQRRTPKDVELLHLASLATRLMHGVRFTSCKSAKDRTGMSVTLEQATILSNEYHLADHERKIALDIMRSEGCRRENTMKNIGQSRYAFTKQQVMALPEEYRPPGGSYGAGAT